MGRLLPMAALEIYKYEPGMEKWIFQADEYQLSANTRPSGSPSNFNS